MPAFYALVDAVPGKEKAVEARLQQVSRIDGWAPVKSGNHDFLVRFDAESEDKVDDFLQNHVRDIPGVKDIEVVSDFSDHDTAVADARKALQG